MNISQLRLYSPRNKKEKELNNMSLTDLWNNIKHTNICITLAEDREKGAERILKEIVKKKKKSNF